MLPINKSIIIPIDSLKKAESYLPETAELVGPYLECAKTNNFGPFYDDFIDVIEKNREDAIITDENGEKIIRNFEQLCDDMVVAMEIIRPFIEKEVYIPDDYEYEYSRKVDDNSVAVRLRSLK